MAAYLLSSGYFHRHAQCVHQNFHSSSTRSRHDTSGSTGPTTGSTRAWRYNARPRRSGSRLLPQSTGRYAKQAKEVESERLSTAQPSPWVCHLQTLTDLDLSENQLAALPESLGQLTELQSLYIAGNQFTVLPEGVAALASLVEIDAANNRLADLPHDLRHLPLTSLWLQGNPRVGPAGCCRRRICVEIWRREMAAKCVSMAVSAKLPHLQPLPAWL